MERADHRYDESYFWPCRLQGRVLWKALAIALPAAFISALVNYWKETHAIAELTDLVKNSGPWGGFSFLVGFVIVFRTSQSYSRYWSARHTSQKMMDDWFESASSFCAFTRGSREEEDKVEKALHTAMRLYSILGASALQELSDVGVYHTWGLETLDANSIDDTSIHTLDKSQCRVELVYQWVQQIIIDSMIDKVLSAPPPIVGRTLAELAAGMSNFHDAMKHAKIPFPLPYAQTTVWLLIVHWILTPLVMAHWTTYWYSAALFTLVQICTVWSLNEIGQDFEKPFGGGALDIDPTQLQKTFNKQLVLLVEPKTRRTPTLMPHVYTDTDALKRLDNIHQVALVNEGWELQDLEGEVGEAGSSAHSSNRCCCCCCRRRRQRRCRCKRKGVPRQVGVNKSKRFCGKRYGVIDGEQTAVLTVGIFTDHLVLAVPPESKGGTPCAVPNRAGEECEVRWKKVPFRERHGLRRDPDPSWEVGDFLDFHAACRFYQEDLVTAFDKKQKASEAFVKKVDEMRNLSKTDLEAGVAAQLEHQTEPHPHPQPLQPQPQTLPQPVALAGPEDGALGPVATQAAASQVDGALRPVATPAAASQTEPDWRDSPRAMRVLPATGITYRASMDLKGRLLAQKAEFDEVVSGVVHGNWLQANTGWLPITFNGMVLLTEEPGASTIEERSGPQLVGATPNSILAGTSGGAKSQTPDGPSATSVADAPGDAESGKSAPPADDGTAVPQTGRAASSGCAADGVPAPRCTHPSATGNMGSSEILAWRAKGTRASEAPEEMKETGVVLEVEERGACDSISVVRL